MPRTPPLRSGAANTNRDNGAVAPKSDRDTRHGARKRPAPSGPFNDALGDGLRKLNPDGFTKKVVRRIDGEILEEAVGPFGHVGGPSGTPVPASAFGASGPEGSLKAPEGPSILAAVKAAEQRVAAQDQQTLEAWKTDLAPTIRQGNVLVQELYAVGKEVLPTLSTWRSIPWDLLVRLMPRQAHLVRNTESQVRTLRESIEGFIQTVERALKLYESYKDSPPRGGEERYRRHEIVRPITANVAAPQNLRDRFAGLKDSINKLEAELVRYREQQRSGTAPELPVTAERPLRGASDSDGTSSDQPTFSPNFDPIRR